MLGVSTPAATGSPPPGEEQPLSATSDVVNHDGNAKYLEFPYLARIVPKGKKDNYTGLDQRTCQGIAVTNRWILTTARCADEIAKPEVILGAHDLRKDHGQRVKVCGKRYHPKRVANSSNPEDFRYNAALLKLCKVHYHPTVRLAQKKAEARDGTSGQLPSWGAIGWEEGSKPDDNELYPDVLTKTEFTVISGIECVDNISYMKQDLLNGLFCGHALEFGNLGSDGRSVCARDWGAPLITRSDGVHTAVGFVGFANGCGAFNSSNDFGVFIRTAPLLAWVKKVTGTKAAKQQPGIMCFNRYATHVGTDGADKIRTDDRADTVVSLGGNDDIITGDNDDLVCAGTGDDIVVGSFGADKIQGGPGNDDLTGGPDNDLLDGGSGSNDRCDGASGTDKALGCEKKVSIP